MAGFGRKKRFLTCFYCGRRTSTQYDGGIRRFDCPNCDATNYLDENGDITDPPVATTSIEPKATQYATSRPNLSRAKDNADSIFCDTCLKNQHLFTASLAQYLPEDPDHPEYEELERKYYKFRKGLERRYPQVCADCEPKVLGRITQAGYTAKTDHLRRMIDRSRENRTKASLSAVNVVSSAGRWLWLAGLWLQLLWHLSLCLELVEDPANLQSSPLSSVLEIHKFILSLLHLFPSPEDLLRYCLYASILSFGWNPQLSQTLRGFSKHIKGLSTWYTYQLMITVTRIAFSKAAALLMRQQISAMAQITAHCVMAMFTIYIYVVAGRSVKIDTTPLFGTSPKTPSSPPPPPRSKSLHTSAREERSMSDLLDEILEAPSKPADSIGDMAHATGAMNGYSTLNGIQNASGNPQAASDFHLGSLNISGQSFSSGRSDPVQYSEEMDWTPTQSRHRAFNTSGSSQSPLKSFGDAPVESDRAQFWYKIPPAPTSMAQRILNPPNQPRLHSPVNKQDLNFRGTSGMFKPSAKTDNTGVEPVEFAQPSLFLPAATDDPRDPLSDMFTQSFSLSQSQADGAHLKRGKRSTPKNTAVSRHISFCVAELAILSVCLLGWLYIGAAGPQISTRAALLIFGLCIAISMDATKDSFYALRATKSSIWIPALGVVFGAAELLLTSLVVFQLWSTDSTAGHMNMGGWLIGATIVHQLWNLMFH